MLFVLLIGLFLTWFACEVGIVVVGLVFRF